MMTWFSVSGQYLGVVVTCQAWFSVYKAGEARVASVSKIGGGEGEGSEGSTATIPLTRAHRNRDTGLLICNKKYKYLADHRSLFMGDSVFTFKTNMYGELYYNQNSW